MYRNIFLGVVFCLLTSCAFAGDGDDKSFSAMLPEDGVILFYESAPYSENEKKLKNTAGGKVADESEVGRFLSGIKSALKREMAALGEDGALPLSLDEMESLFYGRNAFAVMDFPAAVFAVRAPSAEIAAKATKTFPVLCSKWFEAGAEKFITFENGIYSYQQNKSPTLSVFARGRDILVVFDMGGAFIKVNLENAPTQPFSKNSDFRKMLSRLGGDAVSSLYFNNRRLMQIMEAQAPNNPDMKAAVGVLRALGLADVRSLGVSINIVGKGFANRACFDCPAGRKGLFGLMSEKPVSASLLKSVPADCQCFSASRFEYSKFVNVVREVALAGGARPEQFDGILGSTPVFLGFDLKKTILDNLGEESVVMAIHPDKVGGLPMMGINGLAFVIDVKNGAQVFDSMKILYQRIIMLAGHKGVYAEPMSFAYGGTQVSGANIENAFSPCCTVKKGKLIFAASAQALMKVVDTMNGKSPSVADKAEYKEFAGRLSLAGASAIDYADAPHLSMFSRDLASTAILAGMLLPALQKAREAARKVQAMNNLKQIGLAIEIYPQIMDNKKVQKLSDIWDAKVIEEKKVFVSPSSGMGFHYVSYPQGVTPRKNHFRVFTALGSEPANGRSVLFCDGHVQFFTEPNFQKALVEMMAYYEANGVKPKVLEPWVPEGVDGGVNKKDEPKTVLGRISSAFKHDTGAAFRKLLAIVKPYRLPAADCFNRHAFSGGMVTKVDANSVMFETHGSGILYVGTASSDVASMVSMPRVYFLPQVMAIAIPNLLEKQRRKANVGNKADVGKGEVF